MNRARLPQLNSVSSSFEPIRRNSILLGEDSFLDEHQKPIRIGGIASPLSLSKGKLRIDGDFHLEGKLANPLLETEFEYLELRAEENIRFTSSNSSGSLDLYVFNGDSYFLTSGGDFFFTVSTSSSGIINFGTLDVTTMFKFDTVNTKFTIADPDDTGDNFSITVDTHGATTLATVDDDATAADLILDVDGDIELNADGGDITFKDDSSKYFAISSQAIKVFFATNESAFKAEVTNNRGATTLSTNDSGGTNSGHLSIIPDGALKLESEDSGVYIKEYANAGGDLAGYGQLWISGSTPNELAFTDDAGTDIVGIGKYQYETKLFGYFASQTGSYIPLASGYIYERTATTNYNEYNVMIAPYNGTIEKAMFRSEIAQNGTIQFDILESSDGTEVPATDVGTKDVVVNIADDTTVTIDCSSMTTGSNVLTKGRIYAIKITTPANSFDTNIALVLKWDITS